MGARPGSADRFVEGGQGKEGVQPGRHLGRRRGVRARGGRAGEVRALRRRRRKRSVAPSLHQAEQLVQRDADARFEESDEGRENDPQHRACQLGRAEARRRSRG